MDTVADHEKESSGTCVWSRGIAAALAVALTATTGCASGRKPMAQAPKTIISAETLKAKPVPLSDKASNDLLTASLAKSKTAAAQGPAQIVPPTSGETSAESVVAMAAKAPLVSAKANESAASTASAASASRLAAQKDTSAAPAQPVMVLSGNAIESATVTTEQGQRAIVDKQGQVVAVLHESTPDASKDATATSKVPPTGPQAAVPIAQTVPAAAPGHATASTKPTQASETPQQVSKPQTPTSPAPTVAAAPSDASAQATDSSLKLASAAASSTESKPVSGPQPAEPRSATAVAPESSPITVTVTPTMKSTSEQPKVKPDASASPVSMARMPAPQAAAAPVTQQAQGPSQPAVVAQVSVAPTPAASSVPSTPGPVPSSMTPATDFTLPPPLPNEYALQPDDVLNVTVYQEPDMTTKARVTSNYEIMIPLLGRVNVEGLTATQVQEKLTHLLGEDYLVNPQVQVFVEMYHPRNVTVTGAVNKPGSYPIATERPTTLMEAVAMAGGFSQAAALNSTRIIRMDNGIERTITVKVNDIIKLGNKAKDEVVHPNDIIFVPESFF